jgi:hypothetical protein
LIVINEHVLKNICTMRGLDFGHNHNIAKDKDDVKILAGPATK